MGDLVASAFECGTSNSSITRTTMDIEAGEDTKGQIFNADMPQSVFGEIPKGWLFLGATELDGEPTAISGDITSDYCKLQIIAKEVPSYDNTTVVSFIACVR